MGESVGLNKIRSYITIIQAQYLIIPPITQHFHKKITLILTRILQNGVILPHLYFYSLLSDRHVLLPDHLLHPPDRHLLQDLSFSQYLLSRRRQHQVPDVRQFHGGCVCVCILHGHFQQLHEERICLG